MPKSAKMHHFRIFISKFQIRFSNFNVKRTKSDKNAVFLHISFSIFKSEENNADYTVNAAYFYLKYENL